MHVLEMDHGGACLSLIIIVDRAATIRGDDINKPGSGPSIRQTRIRAFIGHQSLTCWP